MMYALAHIDHIGTAANAARSGREILGSSGGDSTSSSQSAQPAVMSVTASATVSSGYLTRALTASGSRQASATAMNPIGIPQQRTPPGRRDLASASRDVPGSSRQGAPSTTSAGTTTASTPYCAACANT